MTTMTIKDLVNTRDLDHKAMASVHGGMSIDQLLTTPDSDPISGSETIMEARARVFRITNIRGNANQFSSQLGGFRGI